MNLIGIDSDWKNDTIVGVILGAVFIFLVKSGTFAIGIPQLSLETTALFLIVVVTAPILEEMFFRFFALNFLMKKLKFNFWFANAVQASLFALFHALVYGSFLAMSSLFISAGLFALVFGFLTYKRNSILPSIIAHAMINFAILKLVIVG